MAGYFPEMRALAADLGLMNRVGRRLWKICRIDGDAARYRSAPEREAIAIA